MNKLTIMTLMVSFSLTLAGCFDSGSEETPPPAVPLPLEGFVADGATYYQTNCATCHKLGNVDTTSAFNAADLAQAQDMIVTDMSSYDTTFNFMMTFNNVPAQRVADLKAYFESIPSI